tara:strand:+ start:53665 stop:54459 length:795 start_codon:yes stop_codon:yes gene_type:complete
MHFEGVVKKMTTEYSSVINYFIEFENTYIHLNQFLESPITIECIGYSCLNCSSSDEIYRQGFCKSCFFESPLAGDWIIKPELSKAHLNIADRDLEYEKKIQLQPHIVYLSNTGSVKVGITRKTQIPYRWIDQGAHEAIEIVETPNRFLAGTAEVALKKYVSDKTNWRKMLKNDKDNVNLMAFKEQTKTYLPSNLLHYFCDNSKLLSLNFPVKKFPEKPQSVKLKNKSIFSGNLLGIKGQYLIFDNDQVLNYRTHEGHVFKITID